MEMGAILLHCAVAALSTFVVGMIWLWHKVVALLSDVDEQKVEAGLGAVRGRQVFALRHAEPAPCPM